MIQLSNIKKAGFKLPNGKLEARSEQNLELNFSKIREREHHAPAKLNLSVMTTIFNRQSFYRSDRFLQATARRERIER